MEWSVLKSAEDSSVNFVCHRGDGKAIEARYVQRAEHYFIVYLSSHLGCSMACRFCHLTATGQTDMTPVTIEEMLEQVRVVMDYQRELPDRDKIRRINLNWMARGEPLSNPFILEWYPKLHTEITRLIQQYGEYEIHFQISTIMPKEFDDRLFTVFETYPTNFYYSLYSVNPKFRKRWLPKAMEPRDALELFLDHQQSLSWYEEPVTPLTLHWAYIEGENDSIEDTQAVLDLIQEYPDLVVKFNLVRYNPYAERHGQESPDAVLQRNLDHIASIMNTRMVGRVGFDVKASCGMFVSE